MRVHSCIQLLAHFNLLSQDRVQTPCESVDENRCPREGAVTAPHIEKLLQLLWVFCHCFVGKSSVTPMDSSLPGSFVRFSRQEFWSGLHSLLHMICLTQGLNPCFLLERQILYLWATREASECFTHDQFVMQVCNYSTLLGCGIAHQLSQCLQRCTKDYCYLSTPAEFTSRKSWIQNLNFYFFFFFHLGIGIFF